MANRTYKIIASYSCDDENAITTPVEISYSSITDCLMINHIMFDLKQAQDLAAIFTTIANARGQEVNPVDAKEFQIFKL